MKFLFPAASLLISVSTPAQGPPIQLHDLYEPAPVQFRFETPGWYLLTGLLLVVIILFVIFQSRKYIKNRYRREALHELDSLTHEILVFPQLFVVLKKAAMHKYGRERVGRLYGKEWLTFLEKTGKKVRLADYQEQIAQAVYAGKKIDPETQHAILLNAKKWVETHAG